MDATKETVIHDLVRHPHSANVHQMMRNVEFVNGGRRGQEALTLRLMAEVGAVAGKALRVDYRRIGDTLLYTIGGKMTISTVTEVEETITPLLNSEARTLVVDLSAVTDMDACGVGMLVKIHTQASHRKIKAIFVIPPGHVSRLIHVANLGKALEIYPDRESALQELVPH